jgi:translation initiation factor IF-2
LSKNREVITFIDTPGHATFTRMRENGCFVADIVILIIAADEGIQSQTEECFEIIAEWKVPVIVAINKIDLPNINIEEIKNQLKNHPQSPNHLIQSIVPISVKENRNIDLLINSIDRITSTLQLEKGVFIFNFEF